MDGPGAYIRQTAAPRMPVYCRAHMHSYIMDNLETPVHPIACLWTVVGNRSHCDGNPTMHCARVPPIRQRADMGDRKTNVEELITYKESQ